MMKRRLYARLALLLLPITLALAPLTGYTDNPIASHVYIADPAARVFNGRVYVLSTHDQENQQDYGGLIDYYLFSSDDMVNWQDHGIVWNSRTQTTWANLAYAPDFIERDGRYYIYFPDGAGSIGVAVADQPEGPYTDPIGRPLVNRSTPNANVEWLFDPGVFIDDDGQAYLYFGGGGTGNARVIRLNNDMISTSGAAITLDVPDFFEALYMHKRNGVYYLSYSTTPEAGMRIDYMTSNNPTSGFTRRGTILPNPWENNNNNNHQSIVEFQGQSYLFYHNRAVANQRGHSTYSRSVNVDRLYYGGNNTIQQVNAGPAGVPQIKYVDAFAVNQAEMFDLQSGITTEPASEGTRNLMMGAGSWVKISGVDFGSGANTLRARVAANIDSGLEVRLNDINSQPIATLQVRNTGGWQTWQTQTVSFSNVSGVHDVYLRSTAGHNLNWYQFADSNDTPTSSSAPASSASNSSVAPGSGNVASSVSINNDWGGGYCAVLTVINNSSNTVTWNASVVVQGTVTSLWNGEWNQQGSTLNVSGVEWNRQLQPGQSDSAVGFCAERTTPPPASSSPASSAPASSANNASSSAPGTDDNLAVNGGVENGLTNWGTTAGTVVRDTQLRRSGAASARITNRTQAWYGLTYTPGGLAVGADYDVSVWVRLAAGSPSATMYLTAKRQDDADPNTYNEFSRVASGVATANQWTQLRGTYTHTGATPFQHFIIESENATVSFNADDLTIHGEAHTGPDLNHPFFVGNITTSGNVRSDFTRYWDQITPENEGKWASVERTRGVYDWTALDRVYNYARANNIPFKQHTFVWGSQSPAWIDNLSPTEQAAAIEQWIRAYCERYPDTEMIDVVNESTPGHAPAEYARRAFGDNWIIRSFQLARQYCPNSILILNDYNVLSWDTDRFIAMARPAVEAGVVDAIGVQAHGLSRWSLQDLENNLNKVAALGLPIYVSEYDIEETDDQFQLQVMRTQFPMFYNHPSVVGITLWGYVVGRTWVEGSGLIYEDGTPRPAMTWLMNYLGR